MIYFGKRCIIVLVMIMDKKFIFKGLLVFLFAIVSSYLVYQLPKKTYRNLKLNNLDLYDKIMFVAHPDDDMIWGGAHLLEDDYVVVCITCGTNIGRLNEFQKVMSKTNDGYIALGYPDKTNGKRDEWLGVYDDISRDIETILNSKEWDLIVTHNENGEYGHIHHIKTNKIVKDIYIKNNYSAELYFFGDYYSKQNIVSVEKDLVPVSDNLLLEKEKILKLYKSQESVIESLNHMIKYEMWKKYEK